MASKRMDLNKTCLFVLSGVGNILAKELAIKMCARFKAGSMAILVDCREENIEEIRKEIESLENNIQVVCCNFKDENKSLRNIFSSVLSNENYDRKQFELAFIVHNEGNAAPNLIIEPENVDSWKMHVQENLYTPIAISQQFLKCPQLHGLPKLVINISSSLWIQPLIFKSLYCSSQKARDMYFRTLGSEAVTAINYGPGIFDTHKSVYDCNKNIIGIGDLVSDTKIVSLPCVDALKSTLKLINILEEISFVSGHDVDYYDTYNL